MNKKGIVIIALVFGLVTLGVFKLKKNKDEVKGKLYIHDTLAPILVETQKPTFHAFGNAFSFLGTFEAIRQNTIGSDVAGKVIKINVQEGDRVSKGQVIAKLDDEILELQLESASVNVEMNKNDDARNNHLIKQNAISGVQSEKTKLALKAAEAQYKLIKKQLKNTSITAPFSGVVTKKMIDLGSVIGAGTPLIELTDISSLKLTISVPERDILKFKVGQKVTLNADVYGNREFKGTVSSISFKADASHNFKVEITTANSKENPLMAGMYGSVVLSNSKAKNALAISRKALIGSTKKPKVFVVRGGKAKLVSFTAGAGDSEFIEVVDGLNENDLVVVKGQINLQNNTNVMTK
jgi:RND family efflux transporter MFP subunit